MAILKRWGWLIGMIALVGGIGGAAFVLTRGAGESESAASQAAPVYILPQTGPLLNPTDPLMYLVYTPDGTHLAAISQTGEAWVWDYTAGQSPTMHEFSLAPMNFPAAIALSHDGQTVAVGDLRGGAITLWEVGRGRASIILPVESGITSLAFHNTGRWFAAGGLDGGVTVWDLYTQESLITLTDFGGAVNGMVFSADGTWLIGAGADQTVRVWDINSWRAVALLERHDASILSMALSPDGRWLATGSADGVIVIWDLLRLKLERTWLAQSSAVQALSFGDDGRLLVALGADGVGRIWDWQAGDDLTPPALGPLTALTLHPAEPLLFSGNPSALQVIDLAP